MLKRAITFKNIDGVEVTEDFYFQITKSEVAKKAMVEGEDYGERLQALSVSKDGAKIIAEFEKLLSQAVGKREGMMFVKNQEVIDYFMFSGAYDAFFMELMGMPDSGASVLRSIFPEDAQAEIDRVMKERDMKTAELPPPAVIEGEVGDAQIQAEKPQPDTLTQPSQFPESPEKAIEANQPGKDDQPVWLKENRSPTSQEMLRMSKEELTLAFKLKEQGLLK